MLVPGGAEGRIVCEVPMTDIWEFDEARQNLCLVIDNALKIGPQLVIGQDDEAVVVLSYAEYQRLTADPKNLSDYFRASPLVGRDLDLRRDQSDLRFHTIA